MFEDGEETLSIECQSCAMQYSAHCADCIVTALVNPRPRKVALVVDADEERALRELASAGLIPEIKMRARTSPRRTA